MKLFIAIDIGSSFFKAACFDLDSNKILKQIKLPSPDRDNQQDVNKFEVDAQIYVDMTQCVIDSFTREYKNIQGLLLSTQQHGFVYSASSKDKYVSWQDQRCIEPILDHELSYLEYLKTKIPCDLMKLCGVPLKPSLGICNLFAMLEKDHNIKRNGELFTLGSYIYSKLIGRNIAHPQNLTQIGIFQVKEKHYNFELLNLLNLKDIKLPEIANFDNQILGIIKSNNQLIKVYPDFGDVQVSALGAGLHNDSALINIATAAQILVPTSYCQYGDFETRPYFNNTYLKVISNMPSGRNIDIFVQFIKKTVRDIFGIETEKSFIFNQLHRILKNKPDVFLNIDPRFYATGDHTSGGYIKGINAGNLSIDVLFTSLFMAMAKTYIQTLSRVCNTSLLKNIVCSGGVSWRFPELIREIEVCSNIPCKLSPMEDESLNGMLLAAQICSQSNQ